MNLRNYTGTFAYHTGYLGVLLTDGVFSVMQNNASWLITDICSILKVDKKVKKEEFVSIRFKVYEDNSARVIYTDGNEKKLYEQKYKYTDFLKHFKEDVVMFFFANNVLMLSNEY